MRFFAAAKSAFLRRSNPRTKKQTVRACTHLRRRVQPTTQTVYSQNGTRAAPALRKNNFAESSQIVLSKGIGTFFQTMQTVPNAA